MMHPQKLQIAQLQSSKRFSGVGWVAHFFVHFFVARSSSMSNQVARDKVFGSIEKLFLLPASQGLPGRPYYLHVLQGKKVISWLMKPIRV